MSGGFFAYWEFVMAPRSSWRDWGSPPWPVPKATQPSFATCNAAAIPMHSQWVDCFAIYVPSRSHGRNALGPRHSNSAISFARSAARSTLGNSDDESMKRAVIGAAYRGAQRRLSRPRGRQPTRQLNELSPLHQAISSAREKSCGAHQGRYATMPFDPALHAFPRIELRRPVAPEAV